MATAIRVWWQAVLQHDYRIWCSLWLWSKHSCQWTGNAFWTQQDSGLDKKNELRFVDGRLERWPPPTVEEVSTQPGLDEASCHWLAERFVGHPSPSIIQPAFLPGSIVRGSFIGGSPPIFGDGGSSFDLDYYPLNGGHWPMVSKPERLANLLIQAARTNVKAEQGGAGNSAPRLA